MLRNTCCVVIPGNEANGVVRHHEPSAAASAVRLDGSVCPMTEPSFIRQSKTNSHSIVVFRLSILSLRSTAKTKKIKIK